MSGGARPGPLGASGICPGNCHAPNGSVFPGAGSSLAGPLGAFTTADEEALRNWITGSPTTPAPPSPQERAKALVAAFGAHTGPGAFIHIVRADAAKKIGFSKVINETNLVFGKAESSILEADRLYKDNYWVCLFINANLLSAADQGSGSATPDHWVVLQSDVTITAGTIAFDVYTWGDGDRHVPSTPPLSVASFSRNYYGYVAAKY